MNIAELDLQGYDVMELAPDDAGEINGGIWQAVLAGIILRTIEDVVENPDDFWDGYNAARS